MTRPNATCAAANCSVEVGPRTPFCQRHWKKLPGKLRSLVSMSADAKDSPVRSDVIGRAARLLQAIS